MDKEASVMPFERAHAPEISELNQLFDNYDFKSLIAVGGMGAVYLAEQKSLERSVAVKILPRRYSRNKTFYDAFTNEAKTVAKLNHQNLVAIYDFGLKGEFPFLVMEYAFGQSLEVFIENELIGYKQAAQLILSLCSGVKHAHMRNVVHRDIKPANVILTSEGESKLVDFGIAKQCGYIPFKQGDAIFGTKGFAAPEMTHSPHLIEARSDIYAIGATLCQLVTGYTPDNLIQFGIEKRRLLGPLYPVVFKAIRTAPENRYQNIEALELAIREALESEYTPVLEKQQVSLVIQDEMGQKPLYGDEPQTQSVEQQKELLLSGTTQSEQNDIYLGGRYKLVECLRQGSRSMVYRAEDQHMQRAVKIRLFFNEDQVAWSADFYRILGDLSRVEHPNIPKVLDGGMYDAGAFVVYGWEHGERIQDWLGKDLDYNSYYSLALQVLDALEVASHYGFHHSALNTFSILREERSFMSGRYLLMDVGVSEILDLIHEETSFLHGVRNEWAAPEQFKGAAEGERSTLYAFSQLLITLVIKGHPLVEKSVEEIAEMHRDGFRINMLEYRDDLPKAFIEWLHRLSEPNLEKRFQSLREARKALPPKPRSARI